jgi:ketosteroid isomerase-like protein
MGRTPVEVINELDLAFNQGNLDRVLSFYEESATVVLAPGKVISGKSCLHEAFASILKLNGKATQLKTNLIESGELALFTSKWKFEWVTNEGDLISRESIATTVLRKNENGEWLIVIDNSFGPAVLG